ncbi:MAG: hypothetical protein K1X75_14890 [Leptospirales bacterium]|nr:hypothetical protein [Leptospirales bacterium]
MTVEARNSTGAWVASILALLLIPSAAAAAALWIMQDLEAASRRQEIHAALLERRQSLLRQQQHCREHTCGAALRVQLPQIERELRFVEAQLERSTASGAAANPAPSGLELNRP